MKKILSLVLVLAMLLCGIAFADGADYKIGVVTELASVTEETYRVGELLAEQYPGVAIHVTYPANAASEVETTISTALSLAYDEDVKAIVFCSGVAGTAAAISAVKEIRPEVLCVVGVPIEDVETTCAAADVAFPGRVTHS